MKDHGEERPLSATDTLPAVPLPRGLCSWVLTWRRCRPCLVQRAGLIEGLSPTSMSFPLEEQLRPVSQCLAVAEPSHFFSPDTPFSRLPSGRTCHWYGLLGGGQGRLTRLPTVSASAVTVRQPPKWVSLLNGKPGRGQAVGDFVSLLVHSCAVRCGCLIYPGRDGSGSYSCG